MRLFHTGDLHIGKRLFEYSLLEDQAAVLDRMVGLAAEHRPEVFVLSGDIYDKSIPPADAVTLFDDFLTRLSDMGICVLLVSGNHDSPERMEFGSRLLARSGVHLAGSYNGSVKRVSFRDEHGPVHIHLLPFLKPALVMSWFPDETIPTTRDAVRLALSGIELDPDARDVLVAHQFVVSGTTEPVRSDSESVFVGGSDQVDASVFDGFDYVALGHLHGPQSIGRDTVRYAGSPYKYSFSEVMHQKSVTMVDLRAKGDICLTFLPLQPDRDLREIRGPLDALVEAGQAGIKAADQASSDYIRAILTDEGPVFDAVGQLRQVYPNLMRIDFDNSRTQWDATSSGASSGDVASKSPLELFAEFYESQTGKAPDEEQERVLIDAFEQAGGGSR